MTTTPKSKPILFSAPMVRALLDGTKTQTRRVCKSAELLSHVIPISDPNATDLRPPNMTPGWFGDEEGECAFKSPYGVPGDQLWVRETWYCDDFRVQRGPYLKPDDFDVTEARDNGDLVYRADGLTPYEAEQPKWKPAIHTPRWASRITLEITSVRVERLQDISESDALAEGINMQPRLVGYDVANGCSFEPRNPIHAYCELWESINGAGSWDLNPWVWVIEFKKVKP